MADVNTTNFNLTKIEVGASQDTWGAKNNTNFDDIDKALLGHYTIGGTANARTITTGLSLSAIPTGMRISFITGTTNTGSTTLNVDGLGAVTCKTVRGDNLPNEYIRITTITTATYNGTNWIVDRVPQNFSNSNGTVIRYADGTQICYITGVQATRASASRMAYSWTFPEPFVDSNSVVTAMLPGASGSYSVVTLPEVGMLNTTGHGTTSVSVGFSHAQAGSFGLSSTIDSIRLQAIGLWY